MKRKTHSKYFGMACVLLAAALWGTMGLYVRRLQTDAGLRSWDTAALRILTALIIVSVYLGLFHREKLRIRLRDLWIFFGTGILSLLMVCWCYYETISRTSLAVAGILLYTAPVFVMLMSLPLFRERLSARKLLALVLAFAGCVFVSGAARGQLALSPAGLLIGLGAGLSYALYSIFSRYAINRGYDSWTITFYSFALCGAACLFLADWHAIGATVAAQPSLLGWIAALGVTTGFLAYVFYTMGLQHMESSRASILASLEPVVAALVGVTVFHERLGWDGLLGVALVLSAIAVLSLPGRKSRES